VTSVLTVIIVALKLSLHVNCVNSYAFICVGNERTMYIRILFCNHLNL